jgi:hypothetical protein
MQSTDPTVYIILAVDHLQAVTSSDESLRPMTNGSASASHTRDITPRGSLADIEKTTISIFNGSRTVGGVHLHRERGSWIFRSRVRSVRGRLRLSVGRATDMW